MSCILQKLLPLLCPFKHFPLVQIRTLQLLEKKPLIKKISLHPNVLSSLFILPSIFLPFLSFLNNSWARPFVFCTNFYHVPNILMKIQEESKELTPHHQEAQVRLSMQLHGLFPLRVQLVLSLGEHWWAHRMRDFLQVILVGTRALFPPEDIPHPSKCYTSNNRHNSYA